MARTCCRWPPARTTSACSTATQGPNTGGMGAYSPAPVVTPKVHARAMQRDHRAHGGRHGEGRHALHRLSLCRPDDRRPGPATHGGVQLPPGRPGNAADPDAPEERSAGRAAARHRRHAGHRRNCNGTAASRWAWSWPQPATRWRRARAMRSAGCRRRRRTCACSMRARPSTTGHLVTSGGRVLCVTALGEKVKFAQQRAYEALARHPLRRCAVPHRHRPSRHQTLNKGQTVTQAFDSAPVRDYLLGLQKHIVESFEAEDGTSFISDGWTREVGAPLEGDGLSRLVEGGKVFERAGCNFSHVRGPRDAAVGHAAPPRTGRRAASRRWACRWCCTRATRMCPPCT